MTGQNRPTSSKRRPSVNNSATTKKKSFKPATQPRYLLGSIGTAIWEADLRMYNRHRFNCFNAAPLVDTRPPKMNPHSYIKTRRLADDASRLVTIDKENKELIKKINLINRSKGYVDTFNPHAYASASRWPAHKKNMQKIEARNKHFYHRLMNTKSVYSTEQLEREWKVNVNKMVHMAKFTLQMFLDKSIDRTVAEMPSISQHLNMAAKARPLCYMDFRVKDGVHLGRIIVELYSDHVPITVENFRGLCKGYNGHTYKSCRIHNIVKGQYLETGDITTQNGKGGISIYGDFFPEENHLLKHTKPGVLSMIRIGKRYNNSQFSITFDVQEQLDGKRVVFGKIVKGLKTLFHIQDLGKKVGSPIVPVIIERCGDLRKKKHFQQPQITEQEQ